MEENRIAEAIHEADFADRRAVFNPTEFSEPDTDTDADALLIFQPLSA
jgi:hypothetical protein